MNRPAKPTPAAMGERAIAPKSERWAFGELPMTNEAPFEVRAGLPAADLLDLANCYLDTAETLTHRTAESIDNNVPDVAMSHAAAVQLELGLACVRAALNGMPSGREPAVGVTAADLLAELRKAHTIIRNALRVLTPEQKSRWGDLNEAAGVEGEGITRANERQALIDRAAGGGQ